MIPRRVLFAYRDDVDVDGGAATVMKETAAALRELGVEVDVSYEVEPDVSGYDLVHAFNVWSPWSALAQLRHLRASGVPVVWLPFYLGWSEWAWAERVVRAAFDPARPEVERQTLLEQLAAGTVSADGLTRWTPNEPVPGFHEQLAEMLACVDHVCAISLHEARALAERTRAARLPFTLTPHGVDPCFADASPGPFRELVGAGDFVLCVGALDARKNQLLLIEALRGSGVRLVLVGPSLEPGYAELCRARAGDDVVFLDRQPRELVASAYAAARVHALPSFAEGCALANLEAAAAGRPLVVSNRSSEVEYFGSDAFYCDPTDVSSIRRAVEAAWDAGPAGRRELARRIRSLTWRRTAEATLEAYARTLEARRRAARPQALRSARAVTVLARAAEVLEAPELLRDYAETFGAEDELTLAVVAAPEELDALVEAAAEAGLDGPHAPDVLAVTDPLDPAELAPHVDATLSRDGWGAATAARLRRLAGERAQARPDAA